MQRVALTILILLGLGQTVEFWHAVSHIHVYCFMHQAMEEQDDSAQPSATDNSHLITEFSKNKHQSCEFFLLANRYCLPHKADTILALPAKFLAASRNNIIYPLIGVLSYSPKASPPATI